MISPTIRGIGTGRSDRSLGSMRITMGKKTKTITRKKIEAWICYLDLSRMYSERFPREQGKLSDQFCLFPSLPSS